MIYSIYIFFFFWGGGVNYPFKLAKIGSEDIHIFFTKYLYLKILLIYCFKYLKLNFFNILFVKESLKNPQKYSYVIHIFIW